MNSCRPTLHAKQPEKCLIDYSLPTIRFRKTGTCKRCGLMAQTPVRPLRGLSHVKSAPPPSEFHKVSPQGQTGPFTAAFVPSAPKHAVLPVGTVCIGSKAHILRIQVVIAGLLDFLLKILRLYLLKH